MVAFLAMLLLPFSLFSQEYGQNLFESFENGIPENWTQDTVVGNVGWVKETGGTLPTGAFDGQARLKFSANATITTDAVARLITPDLNKIAGGDSEQLNFSEIIDPVLIFAHAQEKWTNDFDVLRILYRTSADGKWNKLKEYDNYISKWTVDTVSLAVVSGSPFLQLAFEATDNLGRGVVIDRVEVRSAPSCFAPTMLTVENISNDSADIRWSGSWDVESFSLKVSTVPLTPEQLEDEAFKADVFDEILKRTRKATVKNLPADAKFYFYIRSNCYGEYSTWAVDSFRTDNFLEFPYFENFNYRATPGYPTRMEGWYYGSSEDSFDPFVNTGREDVKEKYSNDTSFVLSFYGKHYYLDFGGADGFMIPAKGYSYAVMPKLPDTVDIEKMYLSFRTIRTEVRASNYRIIVGMMDNPRDLNTFEAVDTIEIQSVNVLEEPFVSFKNYKGKGKNIAFLSKFDVENCFNIDDLRLDYVSPITKVNNFKIGIPSATSISIDFDADYANYEVVASTTKVAESYLSTATNVIRATIADKGVVDGLTAGQHYFVYVRATDGNEFGEWSNVRYVYMPGKVESLPFMLGGEIDTKGTSTHPNWSGGNTYIYKVGKDIDKVINSPAYYNGAIALFNGNTPSFEAINASQNGISTAPTKFIARCNVSSSVAFIPGMYTALVMPEITDFDNARVTFYIQNLPDNNAFSSTVVGLLSDANDISTFTPIDTINLKDGESKNVFFDLGKHASKGKFFAIYASTDDVAGKANDNRFFIDNVEVVNMPPCPDPIDFTFTSAPNDPSKVTMTWNANGANAWVVRISEQAYSPDEMDGERAVYIYNDTVSTNSLTLENLQFPKHKYYYSLRSICDEETYGEWTYFESFETECYTTEELPYVENFNKYAVDVYSDVFAAPCLATQLVQNSGKKDYYPQIINILGVLGNNRLALQKQTNNNTYVAFPQMEKSPSQLQISFDVYWTDINTSISVGVMENPYDSLSFTEVKRITYTDGRTNQTVRYVVSLADYAGKGEHIAISTNSDSKVYGMTMAEIFIDNVLIEEINNCVRPEEVKLTEMFADSVRLEWKSMKDVNKWAVLLSNKELTLDELLDPLKKEEEDKDPVLPPILPPKKAAAEFDLRIDTVDSNPAIIRNLTPNTPYFVYVKSLCDDNSSSMWSNVVSISTACVEISPENSPVETFEANNRGVVPACFMVGNVSSKYDMSTMPMTAAGIAHSGNLSLYFSSQVSGTTISNGAYAITSRINIDDIRKLQISMWGSVGDPSYATVNYARSLIVGVITDPFNISTFVPVDTLNLGIEWRPYDVSFANYDGDDYGGKGQYVMFMSDFNLDNVAFIDDITFGLQKDCYTSVEIGTVTDNSVDVVVKGTAPYQVVYSDKMLSEEELANMESIDIEKGNSTTISNLNSNTDYYVYARSTCDEAWSEWSTVEVVRTNCVATITLPYTDGFEKNLAYGYAANPECWFSYYKKGDVVYPQVQENAYDGERSVLLESASATEQAYLVTSEIADAAVAECMAVFYTQPYLDRGYSETPSLVVGVVDDVNNIADSFVPVDTIMLSGYDWTRQEVFFANYGGKGAHIAFMSDYALNNQLKGAFYIDDVLIEVVPKCARPKGFEFVAHTDTSITVSFTHDSAVKCEVMAGPVGFDPELKGAGIITESVNNDTVEAKGLDANTEYDLYVRTFCNEVDASPWTFAGTYFTVQDYIKELPYVYSFEDPTENAKWGFIQNGQTDKWYIGTDTAHAVAEKNDPNDNALYVSYDAGLTMEYLNYVAPDAGGENPPIIIKGTKAGEKEELNPQSFSWAYRTVYFEPGVYDVSYTWTCTGNTDERGRTSTDFMKVVFVPSTASLCSDSRGGAGVNFGGDIVYMEPYRMEDYEDVIDASGSYYIEDPRAGQIEFPCMQGNNGWTTSACEVMIEEAGMYHMAFAWVNYQEGTTIEKIRSGAIDDISIVRQSCSAPYNLEKTSFGSSTSDFTWSSLEEGAEYIVKVTSNVRANFEDLTDADFDFIDTVSTKSVTATGLTPSTYYNIYVATLCGADNVSSWSEPLGFETLCAPFKVDSLYTFDGISSIPQCFVAGHKKTGSTNYKAPTISRNNSSYIFDRTGVYSSTSSENGAAIQFTHPGGNNTTQGRGNAGGYLVFPMFEGDLNDYTLTFWMRCMYHNVSTDANGKHDFATTAYLGGTYARKISVGTMTDPNDPSTFELLQVCDYPYSSSVLSGKKVEDDPTGSNYWVKFSVPLANAQGQFLVFMDEDYGKRNNWVIIDDVMVSAKYCKEPENVIVESVKMNSAEITFNGEAEKYVVEISTSKDFDEVLVHDTITSLSYSFENLESKTQYFVRVQSVCSAFEKSDWSTITFKTLRGVVFDETFPESMVCPDDWARSNDGKRVASVLDVNGAVFDYTPVSDSKSGWISVDPIFEKGLFSSRHMVATLANSSASWLFAPALDLNDSTAKYHLSFNVALTASTLSDPISDEDKKDVGNKFVVLVSEDAGRTWLSSNITEWGSDGDYSLFDIPNTGASYSVDLTKFAGKSIQIAFCAEALGAAGRTDLHLDDVHVNIFKEDLKQADICQSMDFEDENFMITSDNLVIGENNFTKWSLASKEDVLNKLTLNVVAMKETYLPVVNICEEGSYSDNENGFIGLTKSGRYKRKLPSVNNCDSVVILDLNVIPVVKQQIFDTICQGQVFTWNGKEYSRTGIYSETLQSVVTGCDSIVTLVLTVNAAISYTEYAYICYGESYDFYGQTITESGSYEKLIKTPGACDSLVTLVATVLPDYTNVVINDVIAEGEVYNKNGFVGITKPGKYELPLKSKVGDCDSIVTLNLVVGTATDYAEVNICFGETYQFGSQTISTSGQYIEKFAEDSIVLLNATVLPDLRQTIDVNICKGESYNKNGFENLTETGTYTKEYRSVDGCDSTITLNLRVLNGETIKVTDTITTAELPYDYMTLHYDVSTTPGTYKGTVVLEAENCKDIIEHTLVVLLEDAIDNVEETELVLIPNPVNASGTLYVEAEFTVDEREGMLVEVFNSIGQRVYVDAPSVYPVEINGLSERGVYVVRIITGEGSIYQGKVVVK